ncbi:MAG: hypothetical protein SFX73_37945 [Kofleriaceae bacterium]|nr:hypothetical protein [Kofleriaceae bacterium]
MSGRAVLVLDGTASHEVFEVVSLDEDVVRVRSPMWFEIGEELHVRIEDGDKVTETQVRVRAHVGTADAKVTELERIERAG